MKRLLLAGAAVLSLMTAASAADLAARPYTKAPPLSPATNWSGFYIGAMGGYAFDNSNGGGFGGGTVGYNWQVPGSQFVFGIEVDAAGASIKDSATGIIGNTVVTAEDKVNALGSVTGRVGVAANAALFYAKGGYAWVDNKFSATVLGVTNSDSKIHSGYTIGGGVEYMFAPNWSAKAEYMFTHLDSQTYNLFGLALDSGTAEFNSVKVGINYHFN
ncbi:MAG TPA: outer membrane beta-barrel protein [Bradyrhizobium sp.]